jgi:hypothetical protein
MAKQTKPIELEGYNDTAKPGVSSNRIIPKEANIARVDHYASQPNFQQQPESRSWAAQNNQAALHNSVPMAPKIQVESETTYPKPNRDQNLLKAMFNNPDTFEGISKAYVRGTSNENRQYCEQQVERKVDPFQTAAWRDDPEICRVKPRGNEPNVPKPAKTGKRGQKHRESTGGCRRPL